tara:strand:- start:2088 stop:2399 length:312 start_codon:yes stop_codon:yes gene_type:complete
MDYTRKASHRSKPRIPKISVESLIIEFLQRLETGTVIGSHHIQIDAPQWAFNTYSKRFNPDTFMRKFRGIKNEKDYMLKNAGITLKEVVKFKGEKSWEIQRIS